MTFDFPSTPAEFLTWKPVVRHRALARRVLCVATTRCEGNWSAYIDSVPGMRHEDEIDPVLRQGAKLPESVARDLFPVFKDLPYAS